MAVALVAHDRTGVVAIVDDEGGFGTVRDDDGTEYFFHCTAIADGSRHIDADTRITFDVAAGRLGRWEATNLRAARTLGG